MSTRSYKILERIGIVGGLIGLSAAVALLVLIIV